MTAAVLAIAIVTQFEGFCDRPYQCPAKVWTIGYGTTRIAGQPVTRDTPRVTEPRARELLMDDMRVRMEQVDSLLGSVWLNECQKAALYSFTYNVGVPAFRDSTMLKLIRAGRANDAANEFPKWVYAGGRVLDGLKNRRAAERDLFLSDPAATDRCAAPSVAVS